MPETATPIQLLALAEFGAFALRAASLDDLLNEAARQAMRAQASDISKVLELQSNGDFLVRAGLNLKPGVVGRCMVPGGIHSGAGFAIKEGRPVISNDRETETRFEISEVVRQHHVRSLCNVVILTAEGPYGVLEVDSLQPNAYSDADVPFLQNYANLLGAAIDRLRAATRLQTLLEERQILMRELQHRVKNDFQAVLGLIGRVARDAATLDERHRLDSLRSRVMALGVVHEKLYREPSRGTVRLGPYLEDVAHGCIDLWASSLGEQVELRMNAIDRAVGHEIAVPLGLIVNEFVTNSVKYAFPLGKGTVCLDLTQAGPQRLRLELADNGLGLPREPGRRSGLQLIDSLAQQLEAEAVWSSVKGTQLALEFDLPAQPGA